jgi:hypothetical protein
MHVSKVLDTAFAMNVPVSGLVQDAAPAVRQINQSMFHD